LAPLCLAAVIAGCGSSSSSQSSSAGGGAGAQSSSSGASGSSGSTGSGGIPAYTGPESKVPHGYPAPAKKSGYSFTIGYLQPNGAQPVLIQEQNAAKQETEVLGGKFKALDASASITTQVNQFNQLLSQHVSAIIVYPNDPSAMVPQLKKAAAEGIPVIADSTPGEVSAPPLPNYDTNIAQGFDQGAYYNMAAIAAAAPKSTFATIGFAAPIPALQYLVARAKYWGQKDGLQYLGEVDSQADSASAYAAAMSAILAKYPTVHNVFAFNDTAAQAASAVAASQGKKILISGSNGDEAAIKEVQSGRMFSTYKYNGAELGKQLAIAAYNELTKQHLPLSKTTAVIGTLVTKSNAAQVQPD
jgi:ribose transport system substrate-binding protein